MSVLFGEPPAEPRLSRGMFTSARGNWRTPEDIYRRYVPPCFDVSDRHGGAFSALHQPWPEPWWCNPPYGQGIGRWIARMPGGHGVALLPARTDTRWFHDYVLGQCEIEFIRGRLCFDGLGPAPFPSMMCHYGGRVRTD